MELHITVEDIRWRRYDRRTERPCLYLSKELQAAKRTYWTTEVEVQCFVWTMQKLRHIIEGMEKVLIFTDYISTSASLHLGLEGVKIEMIDELERISDRLWLYWGYDHLTHRFTLVDKGVNEKDGSGSLRASAGDNKTNVASYRQVVVIAGTFCFPTILKRSGIGLRQDLERLNTWKWSLTMRLD